MTAVADARTTLYNALTAELVESPWRVHRTSPAQLVAPTVYVDAVELAETEENLAGLIVATFPIIAVHDGTIRAQVDGLDDLLARVWTAALGAHATPTTSRPIGLDVGGPNLRAHVVRVDVHLAAVTMCAPTLTNSLAGNGGA